MAASSAPAKQTTAWHPPFVAALRAALPDAVYQVIAELLLNHQPQRIDVIVRLLDEEASPPPGGGMDPLLRRLGRRVTAIEFKGPTVALRGQDLLVLLGYAYQYRVQHPVLPADMSLIVVANRITRPFREAVSTEGGTLAEEETGVHVVKGLIHPLCMIETARAHDKVLHMFSGVMVDRPAYLFGLLTEQERAIFRAIYREIKRLKRDPGAVMKYADVEKMTMSLEELMDEILEDVLKEKLLKRLSTEDMLKQLSTEDMLKQLSPEDMLKRLSTEDMLKQLSPEDMLKRLSTEDMLKHLSLEERVQDLSPEQREQLKKLLS